MRVAWIVVLGACGRVGFDASGDGAAGDAGVPALACPSFALFCDGFESGDTSAWTSTDISTTGALAISTRAHSGRFALQSTFPDPAPIGAAAAVRHDIGTVSSGFLAVREYANAARALSSFEAVIYVGGTGHFLSIAGAANAWDVTEDSPNVGLRDHVTSTPTVAGAWTCVEVDLDFASRTMTLYVNDASAEQVVLVDPSPVYSNVQSGITRVDAMGMNVLVDDVVIAAQHIGCT
jgi:hypothetical protein